MILFPYFVPKNSLTKTHRERLAPRTIRLTDGGLAPFDRHVRVATEDDGGAERSALIYVVQPPVGEVTGVPTVDLCLFTL